MSLEPEDVDVMAPIYEEPSDPLTSAEHEVYLSGGLAGDSQLDSKGSKQDGSKPSSKYSSKQSKSSKGSKGSKELEEEEEEELMEEELPEQPHPSNGGEGEDEEEGEEGEEGGDGGGGVETETDMESGMIEASSGAYNSRDVIDDVFDELHLSEAVVDEMLDGWNAFLQVMESREAASDALYAAFFDAAPSLQHLFTTPRAVMAMRFMNGLNQIACCLRDPPRLKIVVETLGFQHLDLEVTIPRVVVVRESIVELLQVELGARLTPTALEGWSTALNYVGGAFIYVRVKYAERLKTLASSWAEANQKSLDPDEAADAEGGDGNAEPSQSEANAADAADASHNEGEMPLSQDEETGGTPRDATEAKPAKSKRRNWFGFTSKKAKNTTAAEETDNLYGDDDMYTDELFSDDAFKNQSVVPKTFKAMFAFNVAVMGYTSGVWMQEVLFSFDNIVTNVCKPSRLQEECDVLSLRIAKYKVAINLGDFKAVMLASLRSLVKTWGSLHEVSWSWLWSTIERMLKSMLGRPMAHEVALARMFSSLDGSLLMTARMEIFKTFFELAPKGQDFFKQSTTRLHFIMDRVLSLPLEMYREPRKMVNYLSGLGLRHVGYGITSDMFGPLVTSCVQVVRSLTNDEAAEEAFRWSLGLISRILQRVINEGSTIVMQAINVNCGKQLKKAVACAPRIHRSTWMLNVQVGTQSISPLMWAIETGSLDAASAIIDDLLTIRADRDRYYFGMDALFDRHPDIVKRMCVDAPVLLPQLLDRLIWRSRVTENGSRRVNYYVKHFLQDSDGGFSKALGWIVDNHDPTIVCHPLMTLVSDLLWMRAAFRTFMFGKAWFLFTLCLFTLSQSVLNHLNSEEPEAPMDEALGGDLEHRRLNATLVPADHESDPHTLEIRVSIFLCRTFIYLFSMGHAIIFHFRHFAHDLSQRSFVQWRRMTFPAYLGHWQHAVFLVLTVCLMAMLMLEPIIRCYAAGGGAMFTEHCVETEELLFPYSIVSSLCMLFYYILLSDLAVLSTRLSAFVLVCCRVVSEFFLFLFALTFCAVTFAAAASSLEHDDPEFSGIPNAIASLYFFTFGLLQGEHFDHLLPVPMLFGIVAVYMVITTIFLVNLFIAQLNCAYQATYHDMLGFARLNRAKIITETMPLVPRKRWSKFLASLRLDDPIEFGEGDIGLAGGVQLFEPAGANITTIDAIRRFGGSTSPTAQWPHEDSDADEDVDRIERIEKLIGKTVKRISKRGKKGGMNSSARASSNSTGGSNAVDRSLGEEGELSG